MIVLDLARVGGGAGISTVNLCRDLLVRFGELRIITGGGVRDVSDLFRLQDLRIDAVLVASSLHDGRIGQAELDLAQLNNPAKNLVKNSSR
jgi:phosphoribosylformimino-5-aminoimidazole carboxamide ribotide isomerase